MNTARLVQVAKEIESLEKKLAALRNEARTILGEPTEAAPPKAKPGTISAAGRRKISLAMKKVWAERSKKPLVNKKESSKS